MEVILHCEECDKDTKQSMEYISEIKYICKHCKSNNVYIKDCIHDETTPLSVGRGGCGPTGFK